MVDPYQPHHIPSSPSSPLNISDDDDDQYGSCVSTTMQGLHEGGAACDSVPIFANELADAETVPADVSLRMQRLCVANEPTDAETPAGADPSVCSDDVISLDTEYGLGLDRTGSSAGDESLFDTDYLRDQIHALNQAEFLEHVTCNSHWATIVYGALNSLQRANLECHRKIQYGDDCSGARAPYEALCQLVTLLRHKGIPMVPIEDMFASECPGCEGDGPRTFINMQCRPNIMFESVHRGASTCGTDLHTQKHVDIPTNIMVYAAGWVCRDVSTMSNSRKELLPGNHAKVRNGNAGASSQTLDSSMQYIKRHRPTIAVLENIVNHRNISIARQALKTMGGYSTCVLLIDSRTFSVPMSRRRMFILAVRTHMLLVPLGDLVSQLKDIAMQLNDIAPVSETSLSKVLDAVPHRMSSPSKRCTEAPLMRRGKKCCQWRWHHNHIQRVCDLPARTMIVNKVKEHSPMASWLPLRQQELIGLHWEIALRHGVNPGDHHFVWDLTNSATFGCVKDPRLAGVVPCALRGHCLWDTKIGRQLSGPELMRVHGFCLPQHSAVAELPNNIIRKLAGDTISVPVVGCILALALANTAPAALLAHANFIAEHHVPSCWIGPSSWRGFDRTRDNLMALAGLSDNKARTSRTKRLERASAKRHLGKNVVISLE
jgi:site-specific DNA-cytosine methylase